MFGLGMGELLIILVLVLIVLGPKRLPDVASTLGKAIRQFRKATSDLTEQLDVDDSVKQPLRELKAALRDEPEPHVLATMKPPANTIDSRATAPAKPAPAATPAAPAQPERSDGEAGAESKGAKA